jgi:hypothetical protein
MYENAMHIVNVLQALLTPTIGAITVYIAWRQHHDSKVKLDLDRYEKRLVVYKAVRAFLSDVTATAQVKTEDIRRLRIDTSEACFLFGQDIPDFIDDLVKHGALLGAANATYRDWNAPQPVPAGYDHAAITRTMHDESIWIYEQFDVAEKKFGKYLNVS